MSKTRSSLDTNALLRLILNDIPAQSAAVAAMLSDPQDTYAATDLAIVEVEHALRSHYGFDRSQVNDTLGALLQHPSITTNLALMEKVFALYAAHPQLSFTDCCLEPISNLHLPQTDKQTGQIDHCLKHTFLPLPAVA